MICNQAKYHNMHKRHQRYKGMHGHNFQKWARANAYRNAFSFPATNVNEEDDHYVISLKVPGYKKEDFKVSILDNILTVKSEIKEGDEMKSTYQEFEARPFKRHFELNEKINKEAIKADYADGILKITLDKKEEFHREEINIAID